MLREALLHLPAIGPERVKDLHRRGLRSWDDLLNSPPEDLPWPTARQERIADVLHSCEAALARDDIDFFTRTLARCDQWRVLGHWFDRATYFDIETDGVHAGCRISVIACLHRGRLLTFTAGHNLDAFLDLLDDVDLLVSFNGASFDVPKVVDAFRIPTLPCPHVDLRWLCYYGNCRGGLKQIEKDLGIERPPDLEGVDGEQAVWLWQAYCDEGDREALTCLTRYCAADVLSLQVVGDRLLRSFSPDFTASLPAHPWGALDSLPAIPTAEAPLSPPITTPASAPDATLESRLRAHLQRRRERSGL